MKLVTYNIQYSLGKDSRYDLGRIAEAVRGADVIALQEVERFWQRSGMTDQPAALAALLPNYFWVYGAPFDVDASTRGADGSVVNRRRQFGNMLLSRAPILSSQLHLFPKLATVERHNLPYGALEGVIETAGRALRVYSLHLSYLTRGERLAEVAILRDLERRALQEGGAWTGVDPKRRDHWELGDGPPPMPADAVLLGDFNFEPGSPEYEALVGPKEPVYGRVLARGRFADAWVASGHDEGEGITLPEDPARPKLSAMRLDYGFVSAGLADRVTRTWIDDAAQGSDHQPFWIELEP